jgi:chromosome segregation ATPase
MANRLKQANEEITVNQMSAVRAAERCHDLERSLEDQENSIFKLKGRIEELESLLRSGPDQHPEEYRKQVARIEELEALLRKLETERLVEVQKLRDEITRLTGLLDEMRSMQSQSQFEVQKFRDEIMRLNRLLDEMRNMQSQPPVRTEPVTTVQHTRFSSFVRPGPSHLLETAMADASSGFRLIPPSSRN